MAHGHAGTARKRKLFGFFAFEKTRGSDVTLRPFILSNNQNVLPLGRQTFCDFLVLYTVDLDLKICIVGKRLLDTLEPKVSQILFCVSPA